MSFFALYLAGQFSIEVTIIGVCSLFNHEVDCLVSSATYANDVLEICTDCGLCVEECLFLKKTGKQPREVSRLLADNPKQQMQLAYSCALCSLCGVLCPVGLDLGKLFLEARRRLVDEGVGPLSGHLFYLSDKKWNINTLYRDNYGIDYSDLIKPSSSTVFFPGCSMATFSPKLTRAVFKRISSNIESLGLVIDCCHKPIRDLGLQKRYEDAVNVLDKKLDEMNASKVITACPMCHSTLTDCLRNKEVVTVYELLNESDIQTTNEVVTIHDSCADRDKGVVGSKVRGILKGFNIVEMEHSREKSICCGAGGLMSAVDQDLALSLVKTRLDEAKATNASNLVVYCVTCANMLQAQPSSVKVTHVLNMIFGMLDDYTQMQANLQRMFTGPKAKENMLKLTS
ncbi:MAG: (Fe-S)-binding protein [Candidatus Bathyarchaeia archaeon]